MLQDWLGTFAIYSFVFILLVIVIIIITFRKYKSGVKRIYKAKGPYLLSAGETKFFDALSKVIDSGMYICPKVRIADLVEVDIPDTESNFWSMFNKISKKHVDFVICNKIKFAPLLVIELDGGSHKETTQIERDEFVDNVFKDAEIPILHIKNTGYYEYKLLREQIKQRITKITT